MTLYQGAAFDRGYIEVNLKSKPYFNQHPPALRKGDTIGIVSLSGPLAARCPRRLQRSVRYLESKGFKVRLGTSTREDTGMRAGEAKNRGRDLHSMMEDPTVKAVVASIGGAGSLEILPELNPSLLRAHPTILVGYSDTTSVLLWLWSQTGVISFYGPAALPQFGEFGGCFDFTWKSFISAVTSTDPVGVLPESRFCVTEYLEWDVDDNCPRRLEPHVVRFPLRRGLAKGPLVAGNLTTLADLLRVGVELPLLDGCVLFLEESDTATFNDFRLNLDILVESGALSSIAGLAWGRFQQLISSCWSVEEVKAILSGLPIDGSVPIAMNIDFGHTDPILTLPIGVRCRLTVDDRIELELLEAAVT